MTQILKPAWLTPADPWLNRGEELAPVQSLPDGRILATVKKRADLTAESIVGRMGVIGVMDNTAHARFQHTFFHTVYIRDGNFVADKNPGGWANWTREEVRAAAYSLPPYACEGSDFGETIFGFPPGSNPDLWWLEARRDVFADATRNTRGLTRRDYGQHGSMAYQGGTGQFHEPFGGLTAPTSPQYRNTFLPGQQGRDEARLGVPYFNTTLNTPNGPVPYSDLVGWNVKNYIESPDYAPVFYQKLYAMQRNGIGMGKYGGIGPGFGVYNDWLFLEGLGEGFTDTVHNTFSYRRRTTSPAGWVVTTGHPISDFDFHVAMHLICGMLYGSGCTVFDNSETFAGDVNKMPALNTPGPNVERANGVYWIPDVPGTAAPVGVPAYPETPQRWHDAAYEAAHFYSFMNRTEGVPWRAAPWRFDGSLTWNEPQPDGADVLVAAQMFDGVNAPDGSAHRRGGPSVHARTKNLAFDHVGFDPSIPRYKSEKIIVRAPNQQEFPSILRGCRASAHNETLS